MNAQLSTTCVPLSLMTCTSISPSDCCSNNDRTGPWPRYGNGAHRKVRTMPSKWPHACHPDSLHVHAVGSQTLIHLPRFSRVAFPWRAGILVSAITVGLTPFRQSLLQSLSYSNEIRLRIVALLAGITLQHDGGQAILMICQALLPYLRDRQYVFLSGHIYLLYLKRTCRAVSPKVL